MFRQGRATSADELRVSRLTTLALGALAVLLGVYPEPFLDMAQTAASQLIHPAAYIDSVFPAGGVE